MNYPDAHKPWINRIGGLPADLQTEDDVQVMPYMGITSDRLRELVAGHYNCMSRLDSLIGDLLTALDESGKMNDTIVIYIGDHGADMLRGKRTCYEGGLRIPMLIRWPGHIDPQIRSELVSTIDLMPTLLKVAKGGAVSGLEGKDLTPLFKPGPVEWRDHYFAEYHTHAAAPNYFPQRSVRSDRFKLIENLLPDTIHPDYEITIDKLHETYFEQTGKELDLRDLIAKATPITKAAYRLMRQPPRLQLYDLENDPHEFQNLANQSEYAVIQEKLEKELEQWRAKTKDPLIDPLKLQMLSKEVGSVKKKSAGKNFTWKYPEYLLQ